VGGKLAKLKGRILMEKGRIIVSVIIIIISVFFLYSSFDIETLGIGKDIGPRFFPQVVLTLIIILSLIDLLIISKNKVREENIYQFKNKTSNFRLYITIFNALIFCFMFCFLNSYLSIFIFVLLFLLVWNTRSPIILLLIPTVTTLGIYLFFHKLLSVRLPVGILGKFF